MDDPGDGSNGGDARITSTRMNHSGLFGENIEPEIEDVFKRTDDAFYALDTEWRFIYLNNQAEEILSVEKSEMLGQNVWEKFPRAADSSFKREYERAMDTQESVSFEEYYPPLDTWVEVRAYPSETGLSVHFRDITTRKQREDELEDRIRQQRAIADLGQSALEATDIDALFHEACRITADVLHNDYCEVLELRSDDRELLLREGVGWREAVIGHATVPADIHSQAGYTLLSKEPVIVADLTEEIRFSEPELLTAHAVTSGISVVIGTVDNPWGIFGTHDTRPREFTEYDADFVQSIANILASLIDQQQSQRQVRAQRERLVALNNLNRAIREITVAAIDQSTREEIEQIVCTSLVGSESYLVAWIGEVDVSTRTITPRATAGIDGFLDDLTLSIGSDDPSSQGPTGRAVQTREMQITADVLTDPVYKQWSDRARRYGYRSSAAIPIIHQETLYGVLNVYSERPHAFQKYECDVFSQLGEIVGHAITAIERKRALMNNDVVELDILFRDMSALLGLPKALEGPLTLDGVIPLDTETYLEYWTGPADVMEALADLSNSPQILSAEVIEETDDAVRLEVQITGSILILTVVSQGGYIQRATIEDDECRITAQLPVNADIRRILEEIEKAYSEATIVGQRHVSRSEGSSARLRSAIEDELTERQRTVLEVAYHGGFFNWPRDRSGEEIAESLGISSPTFHQHLRHGERKLFEALFDS
ncbi:bacterio-opsin activator domain-containing protein (plasmid) [Haloferacaceae archaeon DSL9]